MKKTITKILGTVLISVLLFYNCYGQENNFPVLKGPYLGQNPPGMTPEVFAPNIISTDKRELNSVFSPDGKEFYFTKRSDGVFKCFI